MARKLNEKHGVDEVDEQLKKLASALYFVSYFDQENEASLKVMERVAWLKQKVDEGNKDEELLS